MLKRVLCNEQKIGSRALFEHALRIIRDLLIFRLTMTNSPRPYSDAHQRPSEHLCHIRTAAPRPNLRGGTHSKRFLMV